MEEKMDRCEMCGKLGGIGITRGTSGGYILCYECANFAKSKGLIIEDCDNLLYDFEDDRLGEVLAKCKVVGTCFRK